MTTGRRVLVSLAPVLLVPSCQCVVSVKYLPSGLTNETGHSVNELPPQFGMRLPQLTARM